MVLNIKRSAGFWGKKHVFGYKFSLEWFGKIIQIVKYLHRV